MFRTESNPLSSSLSPLDNQITREETPLPNTPGCIYLIIGRKGSGKSTLALNLLKQKTSPYYKVFDNIYLVSPTANKDPKFEGLIDEIQEEGKYYNSLDDEVMRDIINRVEEFNEEYIREQMETSSDEEEPKELNEAVAKIMRPKRKRKRVPKYIRQPNNLLILDDCIHLLPKSGAKSSINEIFTTSRHKRLSIWVLSQKYNCLNPLIRAQSDLLTIFPTDNEKERETIIGDWAIKQDIFERVYDFATGEPNSFLHISFFGRRPTFYKRFDKIILE